MPNEQMKADFAAAVKAAERCIWPWEIATGVLSLAVVLLIIVAVIK